MRASSLAGSPGRQTRAGPLGIPSGPAITSGMKARQPIFVGDELVAWSATKGHQADIGGNVRGGYNPNATEVWQEALRIPAVKVYERGKLHEGIVIPGPAIVLEMDSTTVVLPGHEAKVDAIGNLLINPSAST